MCITIARSSATTLNRYAQTTVSWFVAVTGVATTMGWNACCFSHRLEDKIWQFRKVGG